MNSLHRDYIKQSKGFINFWNSERMTSARATAMSEGISLSRYLREVKPDLYNEYLNHRKDLHSSQVELINKIKRDDI